MRSVRTRLSRLVLPLIAMTIVGVATCGAGLREDEFLCEEAHARLVECCPGFHVDQSWCNYDDGCGTSWPALSTDESECIRASSCASLRSTGACERAAAAKQPHDDGDGGVVDTHEAVCR